MRYSIGFFLFFFSTSFLLAADFYKWVDEKGTMHFATDINKVPKKYRSKKDVKLGNRTSRVELPKGKTRIKFQPFAREIIAKVQFNSSISVNMIVDTGASITVITPGIAKKLGYDSQKPYKTKKFATAGGDIDAHIMKMQEVDLDGRKVKGMEVAINEHVNLGRTQGLLGLDFFRHFRFQLNSADGELIIEDR